ncbi:hypothetical protein T03_4820 [Trichinella britovi]|uniref:Jerky-like protein-like n=2 Tax=Trichinella TaxID=6333 RepID=A0A0V1D0L9_TRIBR|nr:hypothetical protein T05_5233 [Trichinella murrelli]KRY55002.1 hypothetical protein T03_4820 [Trichinella britovi]
MVSQIRSINLKDCCYITAHAWDSISGSTLRASWNKLLGCNEECLSRDEVEQWLADDDTPLCETLTDDEILEVVEKDENKNGDVSDKLNEEGLSHSEAYFSFKLGFKWREQLKEFSATQLMLVRRIRGVSAQKKLSSLKQKLITDFYKICNVHKVNLVLFQRSAEKYNRPY